MRSCRLVFWDLGGQEDLQSLWDKVCNYLHPLPVYCIAVEPLSKDNSEMRTSNKDTFPSQDQFFFNCQNWDTSLEETLSSVQFVSGLEGFYCSSSR